MYVPNKIDPSTRTWNIFLSTCLLLYGTVGVYVDDIYIPGKRTPGTHFHGEPAWLLYAAMICASLNMLSVVVDHYDIRNNEINYKRFAKVTQFLGWGLFILALVLDLFVFHKGTRH
ncbi:hypothetical protein [Novimethylophilus kurashikiensis]|uniref:hypothetical protein n=1 Tax=Novimethylophilus kurashikiensis TaxID=1825523 RepID=UPI003520F423